MKTLVYSKTSPKRSFLIQFVPSDADFLEKMSFCSARIYRPSFRENIKQAQNSRFQWLKTSGLGLVFAKTGHWSFLKTSRQIWYSSLFTFRFWVQCAQFIKFDWNDKMKMLSWSFALIYSIIASEKFFIETFKNYRVKSKCWFFVIIVGLCNYSIITQFVHENIFATSYNHIKGSG